MTDEYPFQTNYSMTLSLLPSLLAWMLSMLFLWLAMTLIAFCRQGPSFSQCFLNAYEAQLLTKHNSVSLRERLPNGSPCPLITTGRASEAWAVARRHFHCLSLLLFLTESESEGGTLQRIQGRQIAISQPLQKFMVKLLGRTNVRARRRAGRLTAATAPVLPAAAAGDRVFMAQTHRRFDIMDDTRARRGERKERGE